MKNLYKFTNDTAWGDDIWSNLYFVGTQKQIQKKFIEMKNEIIKNETLLSNEKAKDLIGVNQAISHNEENNIYKIAIETSYEWDLYTLSYKEILNDIKEINKKIIYQIVVYESGIAQIVDIKTNLVSALKELEKCYDKEIENIGSDIIYESDEETTSIPTGFYPLEQKAIINYEGLSSYEYNEYDIYSTLYKIKELEVVIIED